MTCELPICKTPHFAIPQWSSSADFGIKGYYDPGQLQHAGSQDTDLSCHVPISDFCCTIHQCYRQTDGQTDVMLLAYTWDCMLQILSATVWTKRHDNGKGWWNSGSYISCRVRTIHKKLDQTDSVIYVTWTGWFSTWSSSGKWQWNVQGFLQLTVVISW